MLMSRKTSTAFLVLALFMLFPAVILHPADFVSASSSEGWIRTYGGTNRDIAESLIQSSDGGYALAGYTNSSGGGGYEFWLVKSDSSGNMEWNKTYGIAGSNFGKCAMQTRDGGYAVAGDTDSGAWLVKTDSTGNMEWNRTYGGSTSASWIVQTNDGGYALAGANVVSSTGADAFWLVKTDQSGYTLWSKTYTEQVVSGVAQSAIQTLDGGYAMVGYGDNEDFLLVKTNLLGDLEWSKTYGSQDKDSGFSIVQTSDGGYVLAGLLWNRSGTGSAGLIKTNSAGNTLWMKNYPGGSPLSMVGTSDGGYVLCSGVTLVKTDSEGNMLWTKGLGFATDATTVLQAHSVIQTGDGGYAITGSASSLGSDGQDWISYAWIVKTDSQGSYPPFSSPSPTATPLNTALDPFTATLIAATVVSVAIIGVGLLVYFKKRKR
jgi:hypothetical protein